MERAHFGGSEKMAPCNMANLDLLIKDKDGKEAHRDIFHPICSEARTELEAAVLTAYETAISKETTENN